MLTVHKRKMCVQMFGFYTKDNFRDAGHVRSWKYYLPDSPNCTVLAQRSGLLTDLIKKAYVSPCGENQVLGQLDIVDE